MLQTQDKTYLPFRGVLNDSSLYSALDPTSRQIRCVDLHSGSYDEPVVCSLVYTTLDPEASEQTAYEALSYCWGSVDDTVGIHVRSPGMQLNAYLHSTGPEYAGTVPSVGNFQVTRNLETALRALRLPDKPRRLWVDAICINQMDSKEKTHQVGHMNLIYKLAGHVLVWLGAADEWSKVIFECHHLLEAEYQAFPELSYLRSTYPRLRSEREEFRKSRQIIETAFWRSVATSWQLPQSPITERSLKHIFGDSLDSFVQRPWFRHMWVFPEVLLAPFDSNNIRLVTIIVGDSTMRWFHLIELVNLAWFGVDGSAERNSVIHAQYPAWNHLNWFDRSWVMGSRNFDDRPWSEFLKDYIFLTERFLASDPRDKVFALLHLAEDTRSRLHTDSRLLPDYEKSILQMVLDYSDAGIILPVEIWTAKPIGIEPKFKPIATESRFATSTFNFGIWLGNGYYTNRANCTPLHDNFPAQEYPFCANTIARIQKSNSIVDLEGLPQSHDGWQDSFVSTDNRSFVSDCPTRSGDVVILPSGFSKAFVVYILDGFKHDQRWALRGTCSPQAVPLARRLSPEVD
jgi:hypothetical protein